MSARRHFVNKYQSSNKLQEWNSSQQKTEYRNSLGCLPPNFNDSHTYQPFSRKSNDSHTYTNPTGGWGQEKEEKEEVPVGIKFGGF
jgi:hypothetical protein